MKIDEDDNHLKIAFVGTNCSGKTTLIEVFRDRFEDHPAVKIVDEAARAFFASNPDIKDRFSPETQHQIQQLAIQQECKAHTSGATIILCDRSVLDAVAYVLGNGDEVGAAKLLEPIKPWLNTYHKIILLNPADIPYKSDWLSWEDGSKRDAYHQAFIKLFEKHKIDYFLLSGTLQERIQQVDQMLQPALKHVALLSKEIN